MMGNNIIFLGKRLHFCLAASLLLIVAGTLAQQFNPDDIVIGMICDDKVTISWKGASGASGYNIVDAYNDFEVVCRSYDSSCEIDELESGRRYNLLVDTYIDGSVVFGTRNIILKARDSDDCPRRSPRKSATPRPPVDTCSYLPADIVVSNDSPYSVQCKRVGPAGVGIADLIAQGVHDAVDIWHIVETSIQVCFRNQGTLKFLDAATSPRAVSDLPSQAVDGMTCGTIDRAGTVVLMHGTEPGSTMIEAPPQADQESSSTTIETSPQTEPDPSAATVETQPVLDFPNARAVVDCPVSTGDNLNLRQGPGLDFGIMSEIPYRTRLTATERAGDWYKVEYAGDKGWIYSKLVLRHGSCAWG